MIKNSQPIFAVRDVKETVAFYEKVLGFSNPWFWGEPVSYGGIHWGDVHVMFNQQPELAGNIVGHQHFFWSECIDELHAKHVERAAPITSGIENKPWQVREYTVRDCNGYDLRFGGPVTYTKPATALAELPPHILLEDRRPEWAEFRRLHAAVGWAELPEKSSGILESSFAGVVAIDTRSGGVVGAARAMRDNWNLFSIWDVMVDPAFQNQRIGQSLMERLMATLRRAGPPGSHVYLFTGKPSFYERMGFKLERCYMARL
jgi:GNAT superfamily N-acetyltransferase/uncharacterized glyoxalase superfamily protein PhnB